MLRTRQNWSLGLFVEWMLFQREESGYSIIRDFASYPWLVLMVTILSKESWEQKKTFLPPMVKTVCKENSSMDASVGFMGAWELNLFYMGF